MGSPHRKTGDGLIPRPGRLEPARQAPKSLFSCEGQGQRRSSAHSITAGLRLGSGQIANIRYGARAFSTLEGYASRNRETELAFPAFLRGNVQPPSWFSSEMGRRQTRSRILGFCACVRPGGRGVTEEPEDPARGCLNDVQVFG